jgi:hypothetical protein
VIPLAEYERRRRDADTRLQALRRQEDELAHDAERQGETAGLAAHAEAFCRRVREGLASAGFDRKRALLELLVERVIVTDGDVEIRYVVPTSPDGEREPFWRLRSDYRNRHGAVEARGRRRATRADGSVSNHGDEGRCPRPQPYADVRPPELCPDQLTIRWDKGYCAHPLDPCTTAPSRPIQPRMTPGSARSGPPARRTPRPRRPGKPRLTGP